MTSETIEIVKLTAAEGKILTDGEIYGKVIILGVGDKAENYHEISEEEHRSMQEEEIIVEPDEA